MISAYKFHMYQLLEIFNANMTIDVFVVCGVWCVVCGVWCVVCGVWRVVWGAWGVVWGEGGVVLGAGCWTIRRAYGRVAG